MGLGAFSVHKIQHFGGCRGTTFSIEVQELQQQQEGGGKKRQNGLVRVEKGKQCIKIVLKLFNSASLFPAKSYSP